MGPRQRIGRVIVAAAVAAGVATCASTQSFTFLHAGFTRQLLGVSGNLASQEEGILGDVFAGSGLGSPDATNRRSAVLRAGRVRDDFRQPRARKHAPGRCPCYESVRLPSFL